MPNTDKEPLSGPALDLACARAMGWKKPSEDGRPKFDFRDDIASGFVPVTTAGGVSCQPRYSSDPMLLDAKLAWLTERGDWVLDNDGERICATWCGNLYVHGDNLHEATARLVVAVKEALGGEEQA